MIIWSGWGILIIVFGVIGIIVGIAVGGAVGALGGGIVGGAAAAGLTFLVSKSVDKATVLMDPQTGQQKVYRKSNSLFFIPMRFFTYIFPVVGVVFGLMGSSVARHDAAMDAKYPGKKIFEAASETIDIGANTPYHGNTEHAQKAAQAFGESFSTMQSMVFQDQSGEAVSRKINRTYCHRGEENVIFLCYVPDLSNYQEAETKKALAEVAWASGAAVAEKMEGLNGETPMYVGLRGFASYGLIMKGQVGGELTMCRDDKVDLYTAFDPTVLGTE